MRHPFLPVLVDEFPADRSDASFDGGAAVAILTHFHSDHYKGLSHAWLAARRYPLLLCTRITRALVATEFDIPAGYIVGLELLRWYTIRERAAISGGASGMARWTVSDRRLDGGKANAAVSPAARSLSHSGLPPSHSRDAEARTSVASSKRADRQFHVMLLDANHIPGSAMVLLEHDDDDDDDSDSATGPDGAARPKSTRGDDGSLCRRRNRGERILVTGDMKFDPAIMCPSLAGAAYVDHVFLDTTWLHLQRSNKFLSLEKLGAALRGIASAILANGPTERCRGDNQREGHDHSVTPFRGAAATSDGVSFNGDRLDELLDCIDGASCCGDSQLDASCPSSGTSRDAPSARRLSYCVRIHLHNHFGKEWLFQELSAALGEPIVVDDRRYELLRCVANEQCADSHCGLFGESLFGFDSFDTAGTSSLACAATDGTAASSSSLSWRQVGHAGTTAAGGGQQRIQLRHFCRREDWAEAGGGRGLDGAATARRGRVEIVSSAREIAPDVLEALTIQTGTPHYGILATGWAKLQRRENKQAWDRIWHLPYSLHSGPDELREFLGFLRPKSVTPLGPRRATTAALVMERLGCCLRRPYNNAPPIPNMRNIAYGGTAAVGRCAVRRNEDAARSSMEGASADGWYDCGRRRLTTDNKAEFIRTVGAATTKRRRGDNRRTLEANGRSDQSERDEPSGNRLQRRDTCGLHSTSAEVFVGPPMVAMPPPAPPSPASQTSLTTCFGDGLLW